MSFYTVWTQRGHSIGWWEGNTLVVDTTHFAFHRSSSLDGVPSGAQKHVVERYTLTAWTILMHSSTERLDGYYHFTSQSGRFWYLVPRA
jgi:hypothetical protein